MKFSEIAKKKFKNKIHKRIVNFYLQIYWKEQNMVLLIISIKFLELKKYLSSPIKQEKHII